MGRVLGTLYVLFILVLLAVFFSWGLRPVTSSDIHARETNVDAFGGLLSAITAWGTNTGSLLLTRVHTIPSGTSCTIGPNIELVFAPGSGVSIESGATVEFWGPIVAGSYRVFHGSGDSVFGNDATEPFFLKVWDGSGSTEVGRSRRPGSGYGLDVQGAVRADDYYGIVAGDISGTFANSQLPDPITNPVQTTDRIYGGASPFIITAGTTLNGDHLAGGMIFCHAAAPITLGLPAISGSSGYVLVFDMTGSGVTIQTTDGEVLYNGDDTGTAVWCNAGNSRNSVSLACVQASGTCVYAITLGLSGTWTTD